MKIANPELTLLACALMIATLPFILRGPERENFTGTDDLAGDQVLAIAPDYHPWFSPLFEPSESHEQWLFRLQALGGLAVLGYCLGRLRRGGSNRIEHASEPQ
jgi:cobalt/nickel transport protein